MTTKPNKNPSFPTPMRPTTPDPSPLEVPQWLKSLPLAPVYYPTLSEFQDPISYILKIEKEASSYGICKIVPPLPSPPRKSSISNLNRSFASRPPGAETSKKPTPTFTTRQQQIGFCPRKPRPVQKPVWQSGEEYNLGQFESKVKRFEKSQLKKCGRKALSEIEVESLFWKATADKPMVVEYANDIPGSGFGMRVRSGARKWGEEDAGDVGDTAWNMRGVSRQKGSLLRFMKEEIPGVTSPMVYVAMMFSWFAWHVEDHELHSLNYLHMGAGKTWYGVPRDARFAFEEVVRVQGYGGEVNPLVTFALLGEKTTVMSPEVLVGAGIPCCRLVQNAGDFIVTFPGSYHCGFSHGYNCGEASNIATPEWLNVAKEAAIRRASINVPPMVSHFQLLYELALSLWSRVPSYHVSEPRSARLKDKLKGGGEVMIKEFFVQSVTENNKLLDTLLDSGLSCVVLPQNRFGVSFCSNSHSRTQMKTKAKPSLGLCVHEEAQEDLREAPSYEPVLDKPYGRKKCSSSVKRLNVGSADSCTSSDSLSVQHEKESTPHEGGLLDQGLLSCVTCGILSFACVAIVQPTEETSLYLMSSNFSSFIGQSEDAGEICQRNGHVSSKNDYEETARTGGPKNNFEVLDDNLGSSYDHHVDASDQIADPNSVSPNQKGLSALDLLASAYGDLSSDLEEEDMMYEEKLQSNKARLNEVTLLGACCNFKDSAASSRLSYASVSGDDSQSISRHSGEQVLTWEYSPGNHNENAEMMEPKALESSFTEVSPGQSGNDDWLDDDVDKCRNDKERKISNFQSANPSISPDCCYERRAMPADDEAMVETNIKSGASLKDSDAPLLLAKPDKDSSRMHVFCLEHAVEVDRQLRPHGGVNIMLLCHPDYPTIEAQAKSASKELEFSYTWKDIDFRVASDEDLERIQSALEDEEVIPMNSDWAVKMGINLYYSASLSKSPLYSKQMPYNRVIYRAFGRNSSGSSPGKLKVFERRRGKKLVVAGRWCGKVWMSNQVHPYITRKNDHEEHEYMTKSEHEVAYSAPAEIKDDKPEKIPTRNSLDVNSPPARTSTRKRRNLVEKSNAKKCRRVQEDSDELPEDSTGNSPGQTKMTLRSRRRSEASMSLLNACVEVSQDHGMPPDDDFQGGSSTRVKNKPLIKGFKVKKPMTEKGSGKKKAKQSLDAKCDENDDHQEYTCDVEGCSMSFSTKQDLSVHKRNICPVKGCGKKFFSHKYLVQHRRVHSDDRPLKCPWKGCKMTFKWAWARTEHIRVHTGDRPYICMVGGCGQTFRFVSDFSRHKRKTGHISKKGRR